MKDRQDNLFSEFEAVPVSSWIEALSKELKGRDYREVLTWETEDGIRLDPFYTSYTPDGSDIPAAFPYKRGKNAAGNEWEINEEISLAQGVEQANKEALAALEAGATSLTFSGKLKAYEELEKLLDGVLIAYIEICFSGTEAVVLLEWLENYARKQEIDPRNLRGSVHEDPLGQLALSGKWPAAGSDTGKLLLPTARQAIKSVSLFQAFTVDATLYARCGATPVQELAFALLQGHEYVYRLVNAGITIDEAAALIRFRFASGTDFYAETAKLRAFRVLWATVLKPYSPAHTCSHNAYIESETSDFYRSPVDQHTNILRATTSAMAAVLGGCNTLKILPFEVGHEPASAFSRRIARNIQLILRDEAHLDKIADPAGGAYFIEHLTAELVKQAWKKFQSAEQEGGFLPYLESGKLRDELEAAAQHKTLLFREGKLKMIGVNCYQQNGSEWPEEKLQELHTGDFPVLRPFRLAQAFQPRETVK